MAVSFEKFKSEVTAAQAPKVDPDLPSPSKPKEEPSRFGSDFARIVAQGVTFGWSDEIEAAGKALFGADYEEVRDDIRASIDAYRKAHPGTAMATELTAGTAASFIPGLGQVGRLSQAAAQVAPRVAGVAAKAASPLLKTPIRRSVTGGAAYGAGASEEEDVTGIAKEAAMSGLLGGVGAAVVPQVGQQARKLIKKGMALTPGQKYGGLLGATETVASAGFGALRQGEGLATKEMGETFTKGMYKEVQDILGKKIKPKVSDSVNINQASYAAAKKAFDESYNEALSGIELPTYTGREVAATVLATTERYGDDVVAKAQKDMNVILNQVKPSGDTMTGEDFKKVQKLINEKVMNLTASKNSFDKEVSDALKDVDEGLMEVLAKNVPEKAEKLRETNRAYRIFKPLERAHVSAGTGNPISPKTLDSEISRQSRASDFIMGEASPMQSTIKELGEVAPTAKGLALPLAGGITASVLGMGPENVTQTALTGGGIAGAALIPTLLSTSPASRKIASGLLEVPSGVVPALAGTSQQEYSPIAGIPPTFDETASLLGLGQ